jgi:hypothetical protein
MVGIGALAVGDTFGRVADVADLGAAKAASFVCPNRT